MNDRVAFLRAIRANPDDDTTRLVFADWLDEHDDPLGEFIRVQIELEPIRYRIDNPRAIELHRREDELLRAHSDDWLGTDHLLTNPADFGPVCRRGFPDYACLSLDTFLQNGEALFAAHPTLREVALYGLANRCSELTMSPLLAKLDTLEIADWPTEDDAISLSVSPHLDRIKRFKLWLNGEPVESHFLEELVKQADSRWPREIELVQVCGGESCCSDPDTLIELNHAAEELAVEANNRLNRDAVHVTRPFEQRFPLNGEVGKNICAGHLPDGRPAIAAGSFYRWVVVVFTGDGRVAQVTYRESSVSEPSTQADESAAELNLHATFAEWVNEGVRLKLGLIWVREFDVHGFHVELFTSHNRERVSNPSTYPPPTWLDSVWHEYGGSVRGWLEGRNFNLYWGGSKSADWRGKIHSS